MEKKLFKKILILVIFINTIRNDDCSQDEPILYDGQCVNRYCSKEEFENETCIINNSKLKIQWLNKIENFIDINVNSLAFLRLSSNDTFIITTPFNDIGYIYIYGLKSNGDNYFNEENGVYYKKIETIIELESLNPIYIKIEDKDYFLICSNVECIIVDYEEGKSYNKEMIYFFGDIKYKQKSLSKNPLHFPIFNLNNENQILFITLINENEKNDLTLNFGVINFLSNNFSEYENIENVYNETKLEEMEILHCFITEKKLIECLYFINDIYKVAVFRENLTYIESILLDNTTINDGTDKFRHCSNCIHLKEEIGVFTYYNNIEGHSEVGLILQINELIFNESNYSFKPLYENEKIILSLDDTFFDHKDVNVYTIDEKNLMKINDNKFAYIYNYYILEEEQEEEKCYIVLIIFDINGQNNENLLIKYYKIDYYLIFGYNPIFFYKINIMTFNSYTGIILCSFHDTFDNSDSYSFPYYILFGFPEQSNKEIQFNITGNLTWKINEDFITHLNNNLFGYELEYKIISIDDILENLKIFSINNDKELELNEIIDYNDSLLFDFTDININIEAHQTIEIKAIIFEPDFDKSIELCDKNDIQGKNPKEYYEPKIIDEKTLKIIFNFYCYSNCETFEEPEEEEVIEETNEIEETEQKEQAEQTELLEQTEQNEENEDEIEEEEEIIDTNEIENI